MHLFIPDMTVFARSASLCHRGRQVPVLILEQHILGLHQYKLNPGCTQSGHAGLCVGSGYRDESVVQIHGGFQTH